MRILVTGGAGYIGSATAAMLLQRGDQVVVLDCLATGHREAVPAGATFVQTNLLDTNCVAATLRDHAIEAVVHFAAFSQVGESVADPEKYLTNNVEGTLSLLRAMRQEKVSRIVFSSTAATYGEPRAIPITEEHPTEPTNPYGFTKLTMERAMEAYDRAYGLRFVALRYFNAAGALGDLGEHHDPETHLIPVVLQVALGQRSHVSIFGTDYDTPDGTCVRDYIHIEDLGSAHLLALDHLARGGASLRCNLGNGAGYSVREVIHVCRRVTGHPIPVVEGPRRAGDPSKLVAGCERAKLVLGWNPRKGDLETIVRDAWAWHRARPGGYGK